jgi:anaphase-promoting complex subunit 1
MTEVIKQALAAAAGEIALVSGVELDREGFVDARFNKDRRLEEVARMLCSSAIPLVKMVDQPEAKYRSLNVLMELD